MFNLPKLQYPYDAFEPYIDTKTMEIHHDKHHAAYVNNLNLAVEKYPELANLEIDVLMKKLATVPASIINAVRNHGGGHANHSLFWTMLAPKDSTKLQGAIKEALEDKFSSFEKFKEEFTKVAMTQFGSGWAWLVVNKKQELSIMSTPNQDTPVSNGLMPLLNLDVWEHAYYLKYQNRRADYVEAWWNVVNWQEVENTYKKAL